MSDVFVEGQRVREASGHYVKMPACVRDLLTYVVVCTDGENVGIAFCNIYGNWRPQWFKKSELVAI